MESLCFGASILGRKRKELGVVRSRSAFARKARLAGGAALLAAVTLALVVPAIAEVRIISSGGGSVGEYLDFCPGETVWRARVIDGPACTLVLSSIPRKRICVTSKAVLGFHAPYLLDKNGRTVHTRKATQAVVAAYPADVRAWIKKHGGLNQKVILLKGRELTALYPRC